MRKSKTAEYPPPEEGAPPSAEKEDAKEEPVPDAKEEVVPDVLVGLDFTRSGTYEYRTPPEPWDHERNLLVDGTSLEVVGVDSDGNWLYRNQ